MFRRAARAPYRRRRNAYRRKGLPRRPSSNSIVPYISRPPVDLPTIRQNPRRYLKVYIDVTTSAAGLFHITGANIRETLQSSPAGFHGNYYQVTGLDFWGTPSVTGITQARLHVIDYLTGIDGDDRATGPDRPRVGLRYPPPAQQVLQSKDDTLILVSGTSIPTTSAATCQCLVYAYCW